jgi:hypothetical protein
MRLYVTTSIESMGWPSQGVQYMVYIRRIRSNCMDRWTNIRFPSQANGHNGHEQRKRISCAKANSIRIRACTRLQNRIIYMYVLTCTNILELASNTHTLDDTISRVGITQQPASRRALTPCRKVLPVERSKSSRRAPQNPEDKPLEESGLDKH